MRQQLAVDMNMRVAQPVAQLVAQPVAQLVAQLVSQPVAQPVAKPMSQPMALPMVMRTVLVMRCSQYAFHQTRRKHLGVLRTVFLEFSSSASIVRNKLWRVLFRLFCYLVL